VHIVEQGDTLFGIALMYSVDADQIRELNADSIGPNGLIIVGQELVISIPSEAPTPTPLPVPTASEPTSVPGTQDTGAGKCSICVLAYHDRNGSTFYDEQAEELLPNAEFTIADASGVMDRYTSDGVSEPYCFTGMAPGAYRVIQNSPPGYEASGPAEWAVALSESMDWDLHFGNTRSESQLPAEETAESTPASGNEDETAGGSAVSRIFATVAKISGVMVLILAAGVAVLFVLNRRRM
jgi:hypothetical protein